MYTGPKFVTTAPADVLAPNGARTSAGTVLTEELDTFTSKFLKLSRIPYYLYRHNDTIRMANEISRNLAALQALKAVSDYITLMA